MTYFKIHSKILYYVIFWLKWNTTVKKGKKERSYLNSIIYQVLIDFDFSNTWLVSIQLLLSNLKRDASLNKAATALSPYNKN